MQSNEAMGRFPVEGKGKYHFVKKTLSSILYTIYSQIWFIGRYWGSSLLQLCF